MTNHVMPRHILLNARPLGTSYHYKKNKEILRFFFNFKDPVNLKNINLVINTAVI